MDFLIIKSLRESFSVRSGMLSAQSGMSSRNCIYHNHRIERHITWMLLLLSFAFIVLSLPYTIYEILRKHELLIYLGIESHATKMFCLNFVQFLLDINHSTNILGCLVCERFRDELKKLIMGDKLSSPRRSEARDEVPSRSVSKSEVNQVILSRV